MPALDATAFGMMLRPSNRSPLDASNRKRASLPGTVVALAASAFALAAIPAQSREKAAPPPVAGGKIDTLTLGLYTCELPGDAGGKVGEPVPEFDFVIANASSYKSQGIRGSYLYTGTTVRMTGGPLKGLRFERVSTGFLRESDSVRAEGPMRCVLSAQRY